MPENNQASDKTKPEATGSSSTQPGSQAIDMNHTNVIVPHRISNHDKLVQTMVMVDGEWVNVNDTNDQKNVQEDMHKVNRVVTEAQKDIINAQNAADSAVKSADSAISASKVNSDAIVAQREAISEAKSTMDSAAASIRADLATVQSEVNTAKTANETEVKSIRDDLKMANSSIATVKDHLGNVSSELDTYAKSAATQGHDITIIQQKQGQFEVDYAGTKGDVNQIKANIKGLSENLKNSEGDVASLQATAKELQSSMSDAEGNISNLQVTAKSYDKIFEDHLGRISKVEQTASELTNEFSDQQGHLNRVEQTAQGTQQTVANQQGQINNIKTDAAGMHQTITGQGNQIANINVTLGGLSTKYEDVSGDLSKLKGSNQWKIVTGAFDANQYTQTARIFYQDIQAKNTPDSGWFYLMVEAPEANRITQNLIKDNSNDSWSRFYSGEWSSWTRDITQLDIDSLSNKITTNSTAIDQTNKHISLKADQTEVDKIKNTASQNSSRLDVMDNAIKSKVTSTDVDNIVNGKGYTTTSTVQSLIDQKADTINESITDLSRTVNGNNTTVMDKIQSITASIDGVQSTVANKADKSQITQLSNAIQSKVSASDFDNLRKAVDLQTLDSADINNMKTNGHYFVRNLTGNPIGGWVYVDVTGNANDRIRQDVYQDSGTKHAFRRWFGSYWTGWSTGAEESEITQLRSDINLRVKSGDLLSQINIAAGHTLIQSNKIYFDADSFVMSPNSKAFIPSAFITDLSADKITSGTLDAGLMRVINLTADNIHGGTLDVGDMNIKNLTANDITTGTLTGIDIKAGDSDNNFELKGQNIYWHRKVKYEYNNGDSFEGTNYGVIGQFVDKNFDYGAYGQGDALTIGDHNEIRMGLVGSYQDVDGSSQLWLQHYPKIIITYDDTFNPYQDRHQTGSLQNKQQICLWTTTKEFFRVGKTMGVDAHLDDTLGPKSTFNIQKDNCIGAYFGQGDAGNQINFNFGGGGAGFNVNGPLHVSGSKNSVVQTSQGWLAINAYETAEYYFGDIGENNTGNQSKVTIGIDRIFNETVNTNIQYQVFVTPYSNAHVWVEQRYHNRFVVCSDKPNAEFGWEIKAKRKGYEDHRLRKVDADFKPLSVLNKGDF